MLEFPGFVLLGVYSPANRDETRDDFRISYLQALDVRIRNLVAAGKQVILTGDLNVIRSGRDTSGLAENLRKQGVSYDDWISVFARRLFNQLIFEGKVVGARDEGREEPVLWDLARYFHPAREGMNTCWDTKKNTRPANFGSRIDYVLCSDGLKSWFTHCDVQQGLMGSDHCPVYATIGDTLTVDGKEVSVLDLVNPPAVVENGQRKREVDQKDLLALSARLIPEFDRRQSIRDMFAKRVAAVPGSSSTPTGEPRVLVEPADSSLSPGNMLFGGGSKGVEQDVTTNDSNSSNGAATDQALGPIKSIAPKRSARTTESTSKTNKRPKLLAQSSETTKSKVSPGQKTLQGFFKPKNPTPKKEEEKEDGVLNTPVALSPSTKLGADPTTSIPPTDTGQTPSTEIEAGQSPMVETEEKVFDPIVAKESWSKLLGRRVVPRCEHNEPCISLLTKKPGINCGKYMVQHLLHTHLPPLPPLPLLPPLPPLLPLLLLLLLLLVLPPLRAFQGCMPDLVILGRSFYICPRPLGPSGEKEKDTEWRCGTFIWSSDWTGSST